MDENPSVREKGDGKSIHYKTLVARSGREFIFLDYLFDTGSGLFGATGTTMVPVSQEEYDRRRDELKNPEWSPLAHIYDEQVDNGLEKSFTEWIESMPEHDKHTAVMDTSYAHQYGDIVREHYSGDATYVECIGGGRMFNDVQRDMDEIYRRDLWELIRATEQTGLGYSDV